VSQQINLSIRFSSRRRSISPGDHDQALGLIVLGMAFLCLRLLAGQEPRGQIGESGRAYEQQKAAVRKNRCGAQPGETRSAARSGPEAHRSRDRLAAVAHGGARNGRSGRSRRILGIPRRLCATDRASLWLTSIQIAEGGGQLTMSGRRCRRISFPSSSGDSSRNPCFGSPARGPGHYRSTWERTIPAQSWNSPCPRRDFPSRGMPFLAEREA